VRKQPVRTLMQQAFRFVDIDTPVQLLAPMISAENPAVLVRDFVAGKTYILTGSDVLAAI
jgi:predicted transcriptional regulator